jgi:glycosyltransferase involved in cell wall biosynthesis
MTYTAIIPTRNRPVLLQRALRSVFRQTFPATQILIVDDGSDDPITLPAELQDARVTIVRHERPQGGPTSRNLGLALATEPFVAFLDDDDEWLSGKMALQMAYLQAQPDCVLVTGGYTRVQGGTKYPEVVSREFLERYGHYDSYIGSFSFMVLRRLPDGDFLPMDPGLPAFQDWDYFLRLRKRGRIGMLATPLGIYHAHEDARITTKGRNRLIGLRRCYFRHRVDFTPDARRWVLSRMIFDRAVHARDYGSRVHCVLLSIKAGLGCQLPVRTKARALAKRALNLAFNVAFLERVRAVAFGITAKLRRPRRLASPEGVAQGA